LEIAKQLYDLGLLFDRILDVNLVAATFQAMAAQELNYRGLSNLSSTDVLEGSFHTACLIGMRGYGFEKEYTESLSGIKKLAGFVYTERFTLDSAILCAAKIACISSSILKGSLDIPRFNPSVDLSGWEISNTRFNRLNKIKKTSPEAFYYFYQSVEG
jgi:hypothetical protein